MAIKMMEKDGRSVPMICCDVCGSWIDQAGLGAAVFADAANDGEVREVLFAHKGECHNIAEARLGPRTGWQELRTHLLYLTHNTGLPPSELQRLQDQEDQFGTL